MNRILLNYLACPDCGADIEGDFEEELEEGELSCCGCERVFPVHNGVPTVLPTETDASALQVAAEFGEQWQHYDDKREEYRQQLLDWLSPVEPSFFENKSVLDGGCGKGRHLLASAEFGPDLIVGVDLGEAIYVAREATRHLSNVQLVRGDMLCLPFKKDIFDYAYSVGVLHHLPNPRKGFNSVVNTVKKGGHISAWVYGYENNEWIVSYVNPIRKHVTNKMPAPLLRALSWILASLIKAVILGIYKPWNKLFPTVRLFYQDYLLYIADFPHREVETIVYDQLNPEIAFYLPREVFEDWFVDLQDARIEWHNRNSWRGLARKPE